MRISARISVNLITLDEEPNIAACLSTLAWTDEIVVVDGGSQDRTAALARKFADVVDVRPFDNFANQRNRAIELSTGDWIFSIDADERVSDDLGEEIRNAAAAAPLSLRGFWVPIRSRIFGRQFRYSGTQSERKLRLFRREHGHWHGAVHEIVLLDGHVAELRYPIDHHSTPDLDTYLSKLIRYSSLEADRLFQARSRPSRWRAAVGPLWTFLKLYFVNQGLLDGPEGFRFCLLSALNSWTTQQKLAERWRSAERGRTPAEIADCLPPGSEAPFIDSPVKEDANVDVHAVR